MNGMIVFDSSHGNTKNIERKQGRATQKIAEKRRFTEEIQDDIAGTVQFLLRGNMGHHAAITIQQCRLWKDNNTVDLPERRPEVQIGATAGRSGIATAIEYWRMKQ